MVDSIKESGEPIIIIDDIEKFPLNQIEDIFNGYSPILVEPDCKIIYTFPMALKTSKNWNNIRLNFADEYYVSAIPLRDKNCKRIEKGIKFFEDLLVKRVNRNLYDDKAIEKLIHYSGGLPFEFQRMIVNATFNALAKNKERVELEDAEKAFFKAVDESYDYIVRKENYERLKSVYATKNTIDDELLKLMHKLLVIEYRMDRKAWYDLHPAVEQLLREKNVLN